MKPVIIELGGNAGVGKDTAADYLSSRYGFVKVAWADELKRFAKLVFDFSDDQLWGPSQNRNKLDARFLNYISWADVFYRLGLYGATFTRKLFATAPEQKRAEVALVAWASDLQKLSKLISPRIVLQTLGTEWGRALDEDLWVRDTLSTINEFLSNRMTYYSPSGGLVKRKLPADCRCVEPAGVVIPDGRLLNEYSTPGVDVTIRLKRETSVDPTTLGVGEHLSETAQHDVPDSVFTYVLYVPEGIPQFHAELDALMKRIQETP
jgi:hypothetical protein